MQPKNNDSENEEEDASVQLSLEDEVELGGENTNKDGISINPITGMINMTNIVATGIGKGLKSVGDLVFDTDSE